MQIWDLCIAFLLLRWCFLLWLSLKHREIAMAMLVNLPELVEASRKPTELCDRRVFSRRVCVDSKLELATRCLFGTFYGVPIPCNLGIRQSCEKRDYALEGFGGRLHAVDDCVAFDFRFVFVRLRKSLEIQIDKFWHLCSAQGNSTASRAVRGARCKIHAVIFAIESFLKFSIFNARFATHELLNQIILTKSLLHVPSVLLNLLNRDSLGVIAREHFVD
mmetsp:Transcript_36293/g.67048  ORF Transcript_36293/g.67048 Transcript_36293/m.67048 type:complete len:219 (+) Transcript_36293:418-1074(+)